MLIFKRRTHSEVQDLERYSQVLSDLRSELGLDSLCELLPKVRELSGYQKSTHKFSSAIGDMVVKCSPEGQFAESYPSLKQSWKFIKTVMEEYMALKRQTQNNGLETDRKSKAGYELLETVGNLIGVKDRQKIPMGVRRLTEVNEVLDGVLDRFKVLTDLSDVDDLQQAESDTGEGDQKERAT